MYCHNLCEFMLCLGSTASLSSHVASALILFGLLLLPGKILGDRYVIDVSFGAVRSSVSYSSD